MKSKGHETEQSYKKIKYSQKIKFMKCHFKNKALILMKINVLSLLAIHRADI